MDTSLPVPDCFHETELMADFFCDAPEDMEVDFAFCHHDLSEDLEMHDFGDNETDCCVKSCSEDCGKAAGARPAASEHLSEHPSDVSSEGSGCFEVPGHGGQADDDGASVSQQPVSSAGPALSGSGSLEGCDGHVLPEASSALKQQYVLVRLDASGNFMRHANDDDMHLLMQLLQVDRGTKMVTRSGRLKAGDGHAMALETPVRMPSATLAHAGGQRKPGGPCCHCSATESPQWRRGPANKPVLCNACGTRYRRTNQLGVAIPSYLKEKGRTGSIGGKKRALGA